MASPDGLQRQEPVLIDWLLLDAPLQHLRDDDARWRLRVSVNGDSFLVDRQTPWQQVTCQAWSAGRTRMRLGFLQMEPRFGAVRDNVEAIDSMISNHAVGWTLARMPVIDVSVLRMATFELVYRRAVPTGVIINEAVELVKRFSTDESPRFVNGVLSAIAREVRPENN